MADYKKTAIRPCFKAGKKVIKIHLSAETPAIAWFQPTEQSKIYESKS